MQRFGGDAHAVHGATVGDYAGGPLPYREAGVEAVQETHERSLRTHDSMLAQAAMAEPALGVSLYPPAAHWLTYGERDFKRQNPSDPLTHQSLRIGPSAWEGTQSQPREPSNMCRMGRAGTS